MKKVLIISYNFWPSNLTSAQRAYSWAKYFKESGIYPIVITRNWDKEINKSEELELPTTTEIKHEINDLYEVYYLPYIPNFRAKFANKFGLKYTSIRKILIFVELLMNNFFTFQLEIAPFFKVIKKIMEDDENISGAVVSAQPFSSFKLGYCLHKKYKLKWIADYRDDWNTEEKLQRKSIPFKIIRFFDKISEKKWVQSSELITSVSPYYSKKIGAFVNKKSEVIYNGYFEEEVSFIKNENKSEFVGLHIGTLIHLQDIELFLNGYKLFIEKYKNIVQIKFLFPGLAFDFVSKIKVEEIMKGYEDYLDISGRVPKNEIIKLKNKADYLLIVSWGKTKKGIATSKIFDYISSGKKVIVAPTDNDIMEEILVNTKQAIICNTSEEVFENLEKLYAGKINSIVTEKFDIKNIEKYSRIEQAKKMVTLVNKYLLN